MRKRLLSILAAGLVLLGTSAWAIEPDSEGVYRIGTADELEEFAALVETDAGANALLTADIDYTGKSSMIGASVTYAGVFDGAGHTVTVNTHHSEKDRGGLFGKISGTLQNLTLAGNVESTSQGIGGFASHLSNGGKLINCVMTATITSKFDFNTDGKGDGTIGGFVARIEGKDNLMLNCVNSGKFLGPNRASRFGGFAGWCGDGNHVDATNCLMIADISELSDDLSNFTNGETFIRRKNNTCVTLTNCYYRDQINVTSDAGTQITDDQLVSGEVAFMLNGDQSTIGWYQNIGSDAYPVPFATHSVVYLNGRMHCDGSAYQDGTVFSNTNTGVTKDEHDMQDGKCNYCGLTEENFVTLGEDGYYILSNAKELAWFAAAVNGGNTGINGRITAPIDLAGSNAAPIGSVEHPYTGTFDGGLQPITNASIYIFGTTSGATITGVALESGQITADSKYANQTGTLIGQAIKSTLTRSYSKATLVAEVSDAGGLVGKHTGLMKDCMFAGSIPSTITTWSQGGLVGSSDGSNSLEIHDCIMVGSLEGAGTAVGKLLGWMHSGVVVDNCYVIENAGWLNMRGDGDSGSAVSNCAEVSAVDFASGSVAWSLNGNTFADAQWYQNIGEDDFPTVDPTHGLVYKTAGGYACATADDFSTLSKDLIAEALDYCDNVVAYKGVIEEYRQFVQEVLSQAADRDAFVDAYAQANVLRAAVAASEKAYADYVAAMTSLFTSAEESGVTGDDMDLLYAYLEDETEPDELFPNGTYKYILETRNLTTEELANETDFAKALFETAMKNGYKVGDEITDLMANADLSAEPRWTGWEYTKDGSTFTTGGVADVMTTAESWNATFDMHQTITGLADGVYELTVNAAYRACNDIYNPSYASWLYANGVEVNVMNELEDIMPTDQAQHMVNCFIPQEGEPNFSVADMPYDDMITSGYVPYGPVSCSYAFNAGRYLNTIVANVKDGQLTVGLRNPGTGFIDWMGFANFRLYYRGDLEGEEAAGALDRTLAGQAARAAAIIAYVPLTTEEYATRPAFSQSLKDQLQQCIDAIAGAATGEQKYELIQQFSALYQQVYDCKKAYTKYFASVQSIYAMAYNLSTTDANIDAAMLGELEAAVQLIGDKWENGLYSVADCDAMEDLKATAFYKYMYANNPDMKDGYYQLASAQDMQWFSKVVGMGSGDIKVELAGAIDLTDIEWLPIGSTSAPFTGEFKGHLYPITGINNMLFGVTNGANISGVALVSGEINIGDAPADDSEFFNGTIIGCATKGNPTTLTRSYSLVSISSSNGKDVGGISGKFHGTMDNVYYVGSVSGGNTTGGLIGSSYESSSPAHVSNCFTICDDLGSAWYRDGLVGWQHGNCSTTNCYAIEGVGDGITSNNNGTTSRIALKNRDQFASGEVCVLLNEGQDSNAFFQTLGTDLYPVLDETHLVVEVDADGSYKNQGGNDAVEKILLDTTHAVNVYDTNGRLVRGGVRMDGALKGLPRGMYIIGGRKVLK